VNAGESSASSRTRTAARLETWEGAKTDLLVPDATSTVPVNDTRSGASMRSIHGSALARACATGIFTPERTTALERAGVVSLVSVIHGRCKDRFAREDRGRGDRAVKMHSAHEGAGGTQETGS
jgi:hypothetical protein